VVNLTEWVSSAGSCKGRCFELVAAEPPGCRCDNLCKTYYSCCNDFDEQCLKTAGGFECSEDRCGENRNEEYACQCSEDCLEKGDCCTNYKSLCKGQTNSLLSTTHTFTFTFRPCPHESGCLKTFLTPIWPSVLTKTLYVVCCFRPYVYAVHSEQPDTFGHRLGPLSNELDNPLKEIDNIIGQLMNGLKQMNLHRCVNVIIVGDHGMEEAHCDRKEYLSSYGLNTEDFTLIQGSSGRLRPKNRSAQYDPKEIVANLTCKMPNQHFKAYLKQHLPKRLHYANNRRIEDIHLLMERKWLVAMAPPENRIPGSCRYFGDHGFDNKISSMRTIFMGHGPSFNFRTEVPPFENIELYNIMCDLLGLTPVPNNGTHGSLNAMLRNPPFTPVQPEEVTSPEHIDSASTSTAIYNLGCSCDDENKIEENATHLPFGRPAVLFQSQYTLLQHSDYISGYSYELHMPLWTTYTMTAQANTSVLTLTHTHTPYHCLSGKNGKESTPVSESVSLILLFIGICLSKMNIVVLCSGINIWCNNPGFNDRIWSYVQEVVLKRYTEENNSINVITGPIFDNDYDGLRDTLEKIREHAGEAVPVPTHYYVIITHCEGENTTVEECEGSLRVISFILPHRPDNSESCSNSDETSGWVDEILRLHTARVRDVELLTGLDFFRSTPMPYTQTLTLKTYMHTFEEDV
uniref:SMB domain-containing protein n=1 Tax=Astyanax mexicanus TaxID=7994 RepID=A0A8B9H6B4_ASTMX